MSNKVRAYAQALREALEKADTKETKQRIGRFVTLLKKQGDLKIAGEILLELQSQEKEGVVLVSARPLSKQAKEHIEEFLKERVKEKVDPAVVGGVALFINNELLIDGTVKKKLEKIFSQ